MLKLGMQEVKLLVIEGLAMLEVEVLMWRYCSWMQWRWSFSYGGVGGGGDGRGGTGVEVLDVLEVFYGLEVGALEVYMLDVLNMGMLQIEAM